MLPSLPPPREAAPIAWRPAAAPDGAPLGRPANGLLLDHMPLAQPGGEPGLHLGTLRAMVKRMPAEVALELGHAATPAAFLQLVGGDPHYAAEEHTARLSLLTYSARTMPQFRQIFDELQEQLPPKLAGRALRGLVAAAVRAWQQAGGAASSDQLNFIDQALVPAIHQLVADPRQRTELFCLLVRGVALPSPARLPALHDACMERMPHSISMLGTLAGTVGGRNFSRLPPDDPNVSLLLEALVLRQERLDTCGRRLPPLQASGLLFLLDLWRMSPTGDLPPGPDNLTLRAARAALQALPDDPQLVNLPLVGMSILPLLRRGASSQLRAGQLCLLLARTRAVACLQPHYGQWGVLFSPDLEMAWQSLEPQHRAPVFEACLHYLQPPSRGVLHSLAGRMGDLEGDELAKAAEDWLAQWRQLREPGSSRHLFLSQLQSAPPPGMPDLLRSRIAAQLAAHLTAQLAARATPHAD